MKGHRRLFSWIVFAVMLSMTFMSFGAPGSAQEVQGPADGQTCDLSAVIENTDPPEYTYKIDTEGDPLTVPYTAPDGYVIIGYCVKAGSALQGDGPEFHQVDPPQQSITIAHSSGKAVSHYLVYLRKVEEEPMVWCSPGYWRNHPEAVKATGVDMTQKYSDVFGTMPPVNATQAAKVGAPNDPTLAQILMWPQVYGGDAFNMVGDYLTQHHPLLGPDYTGMPGEDAVEGEDYKCPLN